MMIEQPLRFLMVGGFLGAGKTTAIARIARSYLDEGLRVGLVTNDQAYHLVDTLALQSQGFDVGEVPGACFCCKFDDLVETVAKLRAAATPEIVIAEPVGSCTDLAATVIEPLRHLHGDEYEIAPLTVLLKPEHGLRILRGEPGVGFSPKAAYIFVKQLEEADVIVINKIDKLPQADRAELTTLVEERFPSRPVILYSARSGDGHEKLLQVLSEKRRVVRPPMDVDYDVYAEGEAELGWLNATHRLTLSDAVSLDELVLEYVRLIRDELLDANVEPAHLKILAESEDGITALANLVGSEVDVELSLSTAGKSCDIRMTVNARVAAAPALLSDRINKSLDQLARNHGGHAQSLREQSFRPGRPTPTHRMC